jgi:hypothetical protein
MGLIREDGRPKLAARHFHDFTPELGIQPHHTSPPRSVAEFAEFCGRMVRRYC